MRQINKQRKTQNKNLYGNFSASCTMNGSEDFAVMAVADAVASFDLNQ
jgi:hypothetical protein